MYGLLSLILCPSGCDTQVAVQSHSTASINALVRITCKMEVLEPALCDVQNYYFTVAL